MEHKPVPLVMGEEAEYMLALKQEFRGAMKTLPFYVRPAAPKKGKTERNWQNECFEFKFKGGTSTN